MLISTGIILLGCIGEASALAIGSPPNDTVSSLLLAPQYNFSTSPISALNGNGPPPPELYIQTNNVRDLQNAAFTKGLVRFSNYNYADGRYHTSFVQDFLLSANRFAKSVQQDDRQGTDDRIEEDYFLYANADPTGGEINLIFQGVGGQMETQRPTTYRDVKVVISLLVSWVGLWQKSSLLVPSTEIVLEVFDGQGYVIVSSGFMFTIMDPPPSQLQDLQTT
ncbi:MAG: hypothetical protein OHK93_001881 [Ramalina farinacea]|uniref:Uncharacterized protein n=1 Tax=Ramalina farinacea TaxID=258253 RepID=A0AA43QQF5_9LECA|nr:hypothetical protein [Ramalina farinacea]